MVSCIACQMNQYRGMEVYCTFGSFSEVSLRWDFLLSASHTLCVCVCVCVCVRDFEAEQARFLFCFVRSMRDGFYNSIPSGENRFNSFPSFSLNSKSQNSHYSIDRCSMILNRCHLMLKLLLLIRISSFPYVFRFMKIFLVIMHESIH